MIFNAVLDKERAKRYINNSIFFSFFFLSENDMFIRHRREYQGEIYIFAYLAHLTYACSLFCFFFPSIDGGARYTCIFAVTYFKGKCEIMLSKIFRAPGVIFQRGTRAHRGAFFSLSLTRAREKLTTTSSRRVTSFAATSNIRRALSHKCIRVPMYNKPPAPVTGDGRVIRARRRVKRASCLDP